MPNLETYLANVKMALKASEMHLKELGAQDWATSYKTEEYYKRALDRDVRDFYDGQMDEGEFIDEMIRLIEGQFGRAFREGARDVDYDPKNFSDEDTAWLQARIDEEMNHVLDFAQAINDAASNGQPVEPFRNRVSMWTNRYNEIVNEAHMRFGNLLEWVYGDTEHCTTCERLNGTVLPAKEWQESGLHPQGAPNEYLECGGWKCQCQLKPVTNRRRTRGGIPMLS